DAGVMKALAVGRQVLNVDALTLVRRQQFVVRVAHLRERDPKGKGNLLPANRGRRRFDRPDTPGPDPRVGERRRRLLHIAHDEAGVMERAGLCDLHLCLPLFEWRDCTQTEHGPYWSGVSAN